MLGAVAGASAMSESPAPQRPVLGVTDTRPLTVRGAGFEPNERVQVLLAVNGAQRWRTTVASSSGVFTVEFQVSVGACGRFTLQAVGSKGSRARVQPRRFRPDCISPGSSGSRT
jgi:hypothetical protein